MKPSRSRRLSIQSLEGRRLLAAVNVPDDLTSAPDAIVSVPVNIDSATGVRAAEIRLSYDTSVLDLNADDIDFGSIWGTGNDTQVTANVDDAAGTVVIFVSASSELTDVSGSVVELSFAVASDAVLDSTTVLDLTQVTLNEGQISVDPAPISGSDSTDGLITITAAATGDDSISGFVYADANNDNAVGTGEAIPGVTITLTNTSTGAELQATTDSDGSYEFTDLAPGEYEIVQSQPVAYLDSGVNELTVTLVEGTTLEDQNFRELGLLPQYIFNRLHTSSVLPVGSDTWKDAITDINAFAESTAGASSASSVAASSSVVTASTSPASGTESTTPATSDSTASGEPLIDEASPSPIASTASSVATAQTAAMGTPVGSSDDDSDETAAVDEVFASNLF
ncbi:cohesin domain-containing protein [Rhodopirellula sp. P2]|uniref:cohesin domain-containing protein n=1 Tax=Rhodopirellula sp. P2 TaxID=2127060 RepID=UPI002368B3A7|nr:cohesin domain-containing protein [Rhodopirellula sp. P2]WDQ16167.1 cohesin domain-containing protein [Rhodopirellula sp. P2]